MISYSTNWMGPINLNWYRERGLTKHVWKKIESEMQANIRKMDIGESYMIEEITTDYAGGRIDIRGVPDEPWGLEYGLPIMHGEDWNALSDYLWDLTTEELLPYDTLIEQFETHYGKKIRWADMERKGHTPT